MIKLYLSRDKVNLIVEFYGDNFMVILETVKEHKFRFQTEFEYHDNVWIKKVQESKDALEELLTIELFSIDEEIFKRLEPKPETERFRIAYNEEYLASPPIGKYQVDAIKKGISQSRLYLAHKMGLGKTFIMIGILNHLWHNGLINRILIVAPSASVYNFRRELLKFNTIGLEPSDIYVANSSRRNPFTENIKVVLMTYRSFLMISDDAYKKTHKKFTKKYRTACIDFSNWGENRAIVLDEAHMIKNRTARQTSVLNMHKHYFRFRYLLSGTPYPWGIEDLYSQIKFMDDNLVPSDYLDWVGKIAFLGTQWSEYAIMCYNQDNIKEFLEEIDPWIIREFAEDNLNLPPFIKKPIYAEISEKQKKIYRYYIKTVLDENKSRNGKIVMREVFLNFPRICLALDNPCILKGKINKEEDPELFKMVDKWKFEDHSKLEALDSLVDKYADEEGKKLIIWSGHPLTIQQLGEHYKKYSPIMIHGEMEIPKNISKEEYRDSLVEEFKKNDKHKILVASSLMLARAVNLVEAPRAVCFDRGWNFEIWEQLSKRNHRIGATETVILDSIILENTLEERLDRTLEGREKLDRDLLKYDSLSKDQWEKLFDGFEDLD